MTVQHALVLALLLVVACTPERAPYPAPRPTIARLDAETTSELYDRADRQFASGRMSKPDRERDGSAEFTLAPLIIDEGLDGPDFGAVTDDLTIDSSRPAVYFAESTAILDGLEYRQISYQWWYPPATGDELETQGVRLTLNENDLAILWEVLVDASGALPVVVADRIEDAAKEQFGDALKGRRFAAERSIDDAPLTIALRAIAPGPEPMGPFVYVDGATRSVSTVICRCMPAQVDDIAPEPRTYELLPRSELPAGVPETWSARPFGTGGAPENPGRLADDLRLALPKPATR